MAGVGRLDQAFQHVRPGFDCAGKAKFARMVEDHDRWEGFDIDARQIVLVVLDVDPVPGMYRLIACHLLEQGFIAAANDAPLCAQARDVQRTRGRGRSHKESLSQFQNHGLNSGALCIDLSNDGGLRITGCAQ